MIRSTLAGASQLKNVQSVYYKILLNHMQLIMLTASFNLNWPEMGDRRTFQVDTSQLLSFFYS